MLKRKSTEGAISHLEEFLPATLCGIVRAYLPEFVIVRQGPRCLNALNPADRIWHVTVTILDFTLTPVKTHSQDCIDSHLKTPFDENKILKDHLAVHGSANLTQFLWERMKIYNDINAYKLPLDWRGSRGWVLHGKECRIDICDHWISRGKQRRDVNDDLSFYSSRDGCQYSQHCVGRAVSENIEGHREYIVGGSLEVGRVVTQVNYREKMQRSQLPRMLLPRSLCVACVHDSKLYVFGGNQHPQSAEYFNGITWVACASPPQPIVGGYALEDCGQIYIFQSGQGTIVYDVQKDAYHEASYTSPDYLCGVGTVLSSGSVHS